MNRKHARLLAVALLLFSNHAFAPPIVVDETNCTLVDAITAANSDAPAGGCPAGQGADTLQLTTNVTLTTVQHSASDGDSGLPEVTSDITVEGGGFTIQRATSAPRFRFFRVVSSGTLTLRDVVLKGGSAAHGGAIQAWDATVTITNSTLSDNEAQFVQRAGGAVWISSGALTITNSTLSHNDAFALGRGGAIAAFSGASVTLSNSTLNHNYAGYGGAVLADSGATVNITNGTLSYNEAHYEWGNGGAVWISSGALDIANSTLSQNRAGWFAGGGGAVAAFSSTSVELTNSALRQNFARFGSGIMTMGTLTIMDSVLTNHTGYSDGGTLGVETGSTTHVTRSSISDNYMGIFVRGTLTLTESTVSGNYGRGGIEIQGGIATLVNSTVSGNVSSGIFVHNGGELIVENSTVAGNSCPAPQCFLICLGAGGICNSGSVVLANSLVADNVEGNCGGPLPPGDNGNNFADDDTCGAGFADITPGVDFDIGLDDNGGPTMTHALLPGSVAIDAAGDCGLDTDQRGRPRNDGLCDSGAFEVYCEIAVRQFGENTLIVFTPSSRPFDVVSGYLSDLRSDGDYSRATCLGAFAASPVFDPLPQPIPGDGRYYLARGLSDCLTVGYGYSPLDPNPREALDAGPCP